MALQHKATFAVVGYRDLIRGLKQMDRDTRYAVRAELRHAGEAVREDAMRLFAKYDDRTAAGFKIRVRQRGVAVEQSLRKTTGIHADYGALQMRRALIPALVDNEEETRHRLDEAMVVIGARFERGGL